jgi:hypothetical protein
MPYQEDASLRKQRLERMVEMMKDTVSEYSDEKHGMVIMQQHLLTAAQEMHAWHAEKARDLKNFIANLELSS